MAEILVIEDNDTMREGIQQILTRMGHDIQTAKNGLQGVELFKKISPDFVITDLKMEGLDGFEVLKQILEFDAQAVIMVITAFGTIEIAVDAMKTGAFDFITKPFPPDLLRAKVSHALDISRMRAENQFLRLESRKSKTDFLLGDSKEIMLVKEQIAKCAPADATVLITGESGTGKDLVAKSIHAQSIRTKGPFIKTDCSSLAAGILESELFGHEKGAFTGAVSRKQGRFELADKGSLFLDEIGELPLELQSKLLRVLQDRSFERVGGTRSINVNVRVIAATNRLLQEEVKRGAFREDLFYRLNIIPIHIPPLRERKSDIPVLVQHFLSQYASRTGKEIQLSKETKEALYQYDWPGNVRELENLLERLCVLAVGETIKSEHLPEYLKKPNLSDKVMLPPVEIPLNDALESLEKQLISRAYEKAGGVKLKTAELLGIKPSALYYKMEKYGIDKM